LLSEHLVSFAAPALRFYRNRISLDFPELLRRIPSEGRMLDVGCFIGLLTYDIAKQRPALEVTAIDIEERFVRLAERHHSLANIRYEARRLQDMSGTFDCILFSDVIHHVEPSLAQELLAACPGLLAPGGYVFIKDVARTGGGVSAWMDRYISRAFPVYMHNPDELASIIPGTLEVYDRSEKYKFPFPNYYLLLRARASANAAPAAVASGVGSE
jgi:2-polyprenyl-3-methyl-5-hydroxy-6-metoxy-1,4-benzoquinol methylase